jgi:hypothetical protein
MKTFQVVAVLLVMVLLAGGDALAQANKTMTTLSYSPSLALGTTADFAGDFHWRGVTFETRRFLDRQFSVGFLTAWQVLSQKSEEPLSIGNTTLSGTQVRTMNTFPFLLTGSYYFSKSEQEVRPYVTGGVGMTYIDQRWDVGIASFGSYNWHFTVAPEFGMIIPAGDVDVLLSAMYTYAFDSGTTVWGAEDNTQQYVSLKLGLVWSRF